jgi:cardiolipin synthase
MQNYGQFLYPSNQLTLLRLVFVPFVILAILYGQYRAASILVLIAGLTDGMDGLLARRLGQQTTLGKFLDPIADKLLLNSAFIALAVVNELPVWLVILVFSRDMLIVATSLVIFLTIEHRPFLPSLYGKASTLAQISTVLLTLAALVFPNPFLHVLRIGGIYAAAALTVISGLQYAWITAERLRGVDQEPAQNTQETQTRPESLAEDSPADRNRLH